MPKGQSGRVVIEVDPNLKRHIYSALAIKNLTLKEWFVGEATRYVAEFEKNQSPTGKSKLKTAKEA